MTADTEYGGRKVGGGKQYLRGQSQYSQTDFHFYPPLLSSHIFFMERKAKYAYVLNASCGGKAIIVVMVETAAQLDVIVAGVVLHA